MSRTSINYIRRATGIVVCTTPIWLAAASVVSGVRTTSPSDASGIAWLFFGAVIAALNAYFSFLRPWLYAQRHNGSMKGFRSVSGIPLIGTIAVMLGIIFSWGHIYSAIVGAVISVIDSGGGPIFLVVTWHDRSFWGE